MDEERLARYLAGEVSDADRSQVDTWAAADPAHAALLTRLQTAWRPVEPAGSWDVGSAWAKVASRLDSARAEPEIVPVWRRSAARWLLAAGVLAAVGAGTWLTTRDRVTVYQTAVGERREVTLSDGSRITLAPASRIEVAPGYGQPSRAIVLEGRAWFEVRHDETRPFRVRVGETEVEDLGTEFEVDASSAAVVVSVMSGSVSVRAGAAAAVTLGPKDVAKVGPSGQPRVDHEVAVERFMAWRKGTLSFENRPMGQVLDELERWHEIDFVATEEIRGRSFTGDLPTDRLDLAMATLTTAMSLTANQSGQTITLTYKAAP